MDHSALLIELFIALELEDELVSLKEQCTFRDANKPIKRIGSLAFI